MTTLYDNRITQLPLRVYTPIADLPYNDTLAEDLRELPDFLHVHMGEMQSLAPVACQIHEPHESLRTVPWIKPPRVVGTKIVGEEEHDIIEKGAWLWSNGRWLSAVPEWGVMKDIEQDIIAADARIDAHLAASNASRDATLAQETAVRSVRNLADLDARGSVEHRVRALQWAANHEWLYGRSQAVIPPGSGWPVFDEHGNPFSPSVPGLPMPPHAVIDFVDGDSTIGPWAKTPVTPDKYRAYCYPIDFLASRWRTGDVWSEEQLVFTNAGRKWATSRPTRYKWNEYVPLWQQYLPVLEAEGHIPFPFETYSRVVFAESFGFLVDNPPSVLIGFGHSVYEDMSDTDTHPMNYAHPLIQLKTEEEIWIGGPSPKGVTGFNVWFQNFKPHSTGEIGGEIGTEQRTLKFYWSAFGKRATPPGIWS